MKFQYVETVHNLILKSNPDASEDLLLEQIWDIVRDGQTKTTICTEELRRIIPSRSNVNDQTSLAFVHTDHTPQSQIEWKHMYPNNKFSYKKKVEYAEKLLKENPRFKK